MFHLVGGLLAVYTIHALMRGQVRTRSFMRTVLREEEPGSFWFAIGSYALLSILLLTGLFELWLMAIGFIPAH